MTIQEAKEAYEKGTIVRNGSWDWAGCSILDQNGWEIVGEFKTVDIEKAKAAYLEAERKLERFDADVSDDGYFDGFTTALDLLGIDYSTW